MNHLLPELLLDIFDLVVHTPCSDDPSFPERLEATSDGEPATFRFVVDAEHPRFQPGITSHSASPNTPLQLSHVCKDWRKSILGEARLWSTIIVTNGPSGFLPLFGHWLDHSGVRPLNLVFRDGKHWGESDGKNIAQMLSLAAVHRERWASIKIKLRYIELPMGSVAFAFAFNKVETLPNLRTLAFSFNMALNDVYHDFNEVWGNIIQRSPHLQELQMWSSMDYEPTFLDKLPWERLTTIILPMVDIDQNSLFLQSLRRCNCLHSLSVSIRGFCSPQPWDPYSLEITSLRNLYIHSDTTEALNNLIGTLHLPSLTHLSIHTNTLTRVHPVFADYGSVPGVGEDEIPRVSEEVFKLQQAFDHWKPSLLSLSYRDEEAGKFQDFFLPLIHHPALRSLEELKVGGVVRHEFVEALTINLDTPSSSPMPNLNAIHIESAFLDGGLPGAVTGMALSRVTGNIPGHLRALHVDFLSQDEFTRETGQWEDTSEPRLRAVDKSYQWIGMGERSLDREFMLEDFSMAQNW